MEEVTMHVTLPSECERFVQQQVQSGRFRSASEVVRAALERFAAVSIHGPETPLRTLGGAPYRIEDAPALIARLETLRSQSTLGPDLTLEDLLHEGHRL